MLTLSAGLEPNPQRLWYVPVLCFLFLRISLSWIFYGIVLPVAFGIWLLLLSIMFPGTVHPCCRLCQTFALCSVCPRLSDVPLWGQTCTC